MTQKFRASGVNTASSGGQPGFFLPNYPLSVLSHLPEAGKARRSLVSNERVGWVERSE